MKTLSIAVCALEVDGRLPLIKFKRNYLKGHWGIPGGKFEDAEFLPEAAEREMAEEIGHRVRFAEHLGVVDELAVGPAETMRMILHVCRVEADEPIDTADRDLPEGLVRWFRPPELTAMRAEIVPSDFRIFSDIILGRQRGYFKSRLNSHGGRLRLDFFEPASGSAADTTPLAG